MDFQFEYTRSKQGLADAFDKGIRDEYAGNRQKTGKEICRVIEQKRGLGYCIGLTTREFLSAYVAGRRFYSEMRKAGTTGKTLERMGVHS